jgi:hypothetical protein
MDLFGFLRGNFDAGQVGVGLNYEQRIKEYFSAFADGKFWKGWGKYSDDGFEAIGGLRMRF